MLPAFQREGKSYLTIAFGCTGGRHRSVAIAEEVARGCVGRAAVAVPPGRRAVSAAASVVAVGGGHGTAVTLRAALRYAGTVTGVVSVADDGGPRGASASCSTSSRSATSASASWRWRTRTPRWRPRSSAASTRASSPGTPLGNLMLAGLIDGTGDLEAAVDEAGRLLGARGSVLPATTDAACCAPRRERRGHVTGQVAVGADDIRTVELVPGDARAATLAVERLARPTRS